MSSTPTSPVVRLRPSARVLLATAATLVLASCSSGGSDSDDAAPASTPPRASATPKTHKASPSASPKPSLPAPADGTDTKACADGTCEIRVNGPVKVPLPASFGLGPLQVTGVDATTVTILAPLTQSQFDSDGGCSSAVTGPGTGTSAHVDMTCHTGEKAVVNKMRLEVLGVVGNAAVINLRPAK